GQLPGRALRHRLAQLLGVVEQLAPDDLAVADLQHLRGAERPRHRLHRPVAHRAHPVGVAALVADAEAGTAAPAWRATSSTAWAGPTSSTGSSSPPPAARPGPGPGGKAPASPPP